MKIKKSIIKLITIGSMLFGIVALMNILFPNDNKDHFKTISHQISNTKESSYYFIGSSRVQKSINPKILNKYFNTKNVHNLAISSSTFLSNCILTDFLIQNKTRKTIFIELSPIIPEIPKGLLLFSDEANINLFKRLNSLNEYQKINQKILFNLNVLNSYLFLKIPLKDNLKKMLHINDNGKTKKLMGFIPIENSKYNSISSFITHEEINSSFYNKEKLVLYQNYINHLLKTGHQNNAKVVFFLPVTYLKKKEKTIVIPLYNSLPDSAKIKYPKEFLENIAKAEYLSDRNHFNVKGAETYSSQLCPLVEQYFDHKN